jgi:hypothetical protein
MSSAAQTALRSRNASSMGPLSGAFLTPKALTYNRFAVEEWNNFHRRTL